MPTYERRFYLSLLTEENTKRRETIENQSQTSGGKGNRVTKIGGDKLVNMIKNGQLPNM